MFSFAYLTVLLAAATNGAKTPAPRVPAARVPPLAACAAVTRADVQQILRVVVRPGEDETDGAASACDYAGGNGRVTITLQRLTAKLNIRTEIESLKATLPESTVREAPGFGATALFLDIAGAGTQLFIIREQDYVMVSILGFGEPPQVSPAAEALARKALGRL